MSDDRAPLPNRSGSSIRQLVRARKFPEALRVRADLSAGIECLRLNVSCTGKAANPEKVQAIGIDRDVWQTIFATSLGSSGQRPSEASTVNFSRLRATISVMVSSLSIASPFFLWVPLALHRHSGSRSYRKSMTNMSSGEAESSITKKNRCVTAPSTTARE